MVISSYYLCIDSGDFKYIGIDRMSIILGVA